LVSTPEVCFAVVVFGKFQKRLFGGDYFSGEHVCQP
jgi:hypothetical protein